jgi:hypothetical protein
MFLAMWGSGKGRRERKVVAVKKFIATVIRSNTTNEWWSEGDATMT